MQCFKNLVFEGGGVKMTSYVGCLEYLEEREILDDIIRVAGTSGGALAAFMIALNYSIEEIKGIITKTNFAKFGLEEESYYQIVKNLSSGYGLCSGYALYRFIDRLVRDKIGFDDATFEDLIEYQKRIGITKDLYLIGTCLNTKYSTKFSFYHTPKMEIAKALRISMSFPFYFKAIKHGENENGFPMWYMDGGLLSNYPLHIFDQPCFVTERESLVDHKGFIPHKYFNKETLGFRLDSKEKISVITETKKPNARSIKGFKDFITTVLNTLLNQQDNYFRDSYDWSRTVFVDTLGVSTLDFHISRTTKLKLIRSGYEATKKYFEGINGN